MASRTPSTSTPAAPGALLQQAVQLHQNGQLDQAAGLYRAVLAARPGDADASLYLGMILRQAGQFEAARQALAVAVRARPRDVGAQIELALAASQAGDMALAEQCATQVVKLDPRLPEGHLIAADVLLRAGKPAQALEQATEAARLRAGWVDAIVMRGNALALLGRFEEAAGPFGEALALVPGHPELHRNLGNALRQAGRHVEAVEQYRAALAIDPASALARVYLGVSLRATGHSDEAVAELRKAVAVAPELAEAHFELANLLAERGFHEDALASFEAAIRCQDTHVDARVNLAVTLNLLGRLDEAHDLLRRTVELVPRHAESWDKLAELHYQRRQFAEGEAVCRRAIPLVDEPSRLYLRLGALLQVQGRYDEAIIAFDECAGRTPDRTQFGYFDARFGKSLALLAIGRLDEGWAEHRWRYHRHKVLAQDPGYVGDPASLQGNLHGKVIQVDTEQGVGDELFYLRFAPRLQARGARLILGCNTKLRGILRDAGFELAGDPAVGGVARDFRILVGDLPQAAGPGAGPGVPLRLVPDPARMAALRETLASLGPPPYTGVTWRAGIDAVQAKALGQRQTLKAIPPEVLGRTLRGCGGTVLVLQRQPAANDIAHFSQALGAGARDLSHVNDDLDQMLALLALLNRYVCLSNTNLHLAAGLTGCEVHALVRHPPEWRWYGQGASSPWFPDLFAYRQKADGDWEAALRALRSALNPASG